MFEFTRFSKRSIAFMNRVKNEVVAIAYYTAYTEVNGID
jgi:hypothetical protein